MHPTPDSVLMLADVRHCQLQDEAARIRSGSDVIKALAMGARAVGVGRPFVYGLALDGAEGAAHVLKCILAEADLMMAVNGMPTLDLVRAEGVRRA